MNREEIARCLIFGAGDYAGTPDVAGACEDSLIIAADGGYKYLANHVRYVSDDYDTF